MPSNAKRAGVAPTSLPQPNISASNSMKSGPKPPSNPTLSEKSTVNPRSDKPRAFNGSGSTEEENWQPTGKENANDVSGDATTAASAGGNRKKQKRRQKQAARLAAEQQLDNGYVSEEALPRNGHLPYSSENHGSHYLEHGASGGDVDYADPDFDPEQYEPVEGDDLYFTDDDGRLYAQPLAQGPGTKNGFTNEDLVGADGKKSKKKKKKQNRSSAIQEPQPNHVEGSSTSLSTPSASIARPPPPPPPPLSNAALRSAHNISRDRIWNTSTQEERERIKQFWLSLGEEDRRSLVKVEKEAVLRKMKEQQKHSCSCTVCGRKRTAIEEELEVLYDAYYDELEQYANHHQGSFADGTPMMPPPRSYHQTRRPLSHLMTERHPSRGRIEEIGDDDEEFDEDYDDDEDEEGDSEEYLEEDARSTPADFFTFGNSLTVKDGILTVADDLLKNDGKHFIDMMEQLAERRMQREEETQYASSALAHQALHAGHNHGPPLDEEDDYDDDDDDYGSEDEEDYEDDEMDQMTEEQRMEEGRRMFQIFAARMFEQRVLTAYREKVARERQQKLIEELEEESRLDVQREAKKAREAQKKKDKKRLQKQAKEEEKAKREAEKAEEEAAARAIEEKKLEEQRQKKEEQRRKKEAEKKAADEERVRKETEKQKKLQEERDRQLEIERKQREQKEREKKKREEAKKKEREDREGKEKEIKEKKAKEECDRKALEEQVKKEKEASAKAEKEAKEAERREEQAKQAAQATSLACKRPSQPGHVPLPPGLQLPQGPAALQSPHFTVATPVVPKAPTPVRTRQTSQQGSHASSPRSQQAGTDNSQSQPSASPGNASLPQSSVSSSATSAKGQAPMLHHPQPSAPMSPLGGAGRGGHPAFGYNGTQSNAPMMPGMSQRAPLGHDFPIHQQHQPLGGQYRNYTSPNGIPMPPGINGNRPIQPGRGFPADANYGLPFHNQPPMQQSVPAVQNPQPRDNPRSQPHSRQQSASFERPSIDTNHQTQPIGRPAPIRRPSSTAPLDRPRDNQKPARTDIDDLSTQLGSSALLEDTDVPLTSNVTESMQATAPPGAPGSGRLGFGASPLFPDTFGTSKHDNFHIGGQAGAGATWGSQMPFGTAGLPGAPNWGTSPGAGWSNNAFGIIGGAHRPHASRPVTIRLMISQACKQLTANSPTKGSNGFHNVNQILRQVDQLKPSNEPAITLNEMLEICDTEGNSHNGGGSFIIKNEGPRGTFVKFESDSNNMPAPGRGGIIAPGEIGSPISGGNAPPFGGAGARPFQPQGNISPHTTGF